MGKSSPEPSSRKTVTLPVHLWEQISEYRFSQRIATEAEALRRLVQLDLETAEKAASVSVTRQRSRGT